MPTAESMGDSSSLPTHLNSGVLNGNGTADDSGGPEERSPRGAPHAGATQTPPSPGSEVEELRNCCVNSGSPNSSLYPPTHLEVEALAEGFHEGSRDISQPRPSPEVLSITRDSSMRFQRCLQKAGERLSECTDRILVLLWRVFTFKARHPIATAVGILAPPCAILTRYQDNEVQRQTHFCPLTTHGLLVCTSSKLHDYFQKECISLDWSSQMSFVPANTSRDAFLDCNFGAYQNPTIKTLSDFGPCLFPTSLMPSFGRHYDGLSLMYLPARLHYGGYLAFVDKSGSDCSQLRQFLEKFVNTVSPYLAFCVLHVVDLMEKTTESELFITFPSERDLEKYQSTAAAASKRPVYSAVICRAAGPGQLDVTIRMHVRRGTPRSFANDTIKNRIRFYSGYDSMTYFGGSPYLLAADVVGTPAENAAYGHLTGGFLDLLTLAHAFNLHRTGVRKTPADPIASRRLQPQWRHISELFFKIFDYFGRIPVLDSVAFSKASTQVVVLLVGEAERHLAEILALVACVSSTFNQSFTTSRTLIAALRIPVWLLGPGIMIIQLYTQQAAEAGCNSESPAMHLCAIFQVFHSRTKDMGVGMVMAALVPLHNILRVFSAPMRKAYSPVDFMETAMPHVAATTISSSTKPNSCSAPFVVLLVCILWQVVKAIMVDKEAGFKNMLEIMGVPDRILWLSWYLFFVIFNFPLILILALVASYLVFTQTSFWLVLLLFSVAVLASISFAVFITALFKDGNLAAMAGCAWYILIWVPVVCQRCGTSAWSPHLQRAFMVSCPAAAFGVALDIAWLFNEPFLGGVTRQSIERSGCSQRLRLWDPHRRHGLRWRADGMTYPDKSEDVNDDGKPFLEVRGVHKIFRAWQPKKCRRTSVHAVRDVSFSVFRGEIFGLLGQNGAGKTTLISMMTGSLAPSAGEIAIGGISVRQHPGLARRNVGYCPQFDVLLPYLTVEETLWVYACLRGIPRSRREDEVACLMHMMKLSEMARVQVRQLSGGWKRRVSTSVAFLGNPTVVFLDEPTAGMDIMYRRTLWDSVRGLSKGRSIILITHMMEEADYLCDRVGIMASGSIVCSGSAISLKNRFGSGYTISVILKKQEERKALDAKHMLMLCMRSLDCPLVVEEVSRNELKIICPFKCSFQLPSLFSELEGSGARFGVEGLVLSFASLEEVFLNVTRLAMQSPNCAEIEISSAPNAVEALEGQAGEGAGPTSSLQEQANPNSLTSGGLALSRSAQRCLNRKEAVFSSATSVRHSSSSSPARSPLGAERANKEDDVPSLSDASAPCLSSLVDNSLSAHVNSRRSLRGAALLEARTSDDSISKRIIMQTRIMRALVVKRIKLVYRDWAHLTVSFVIPLLLMGLTLYLRTDKSEPRVPLSGRQLFEYRLPRSVHAQVPYGGTGWMLGALNRCHSPYMTHDNVSSEVQTNDEMYEYLLNGYFGPHPPRFGAYVVHGSEPDLSDTADQLDATIWHNSTLRDSVPLFYNHLINCLAEDRTGVVEAVLASNQPFEDNDDKFMDGVVVAFFTVISFSFVAAGVGQICIEERVRKVRHQQILAGITPLQYWLSAYIVDFVLLLIPCSLIYGLLVWTDISPLVGPYQRPAFLLGMVLFCLSVCPLGYAISAAVDSPMTFVMVMLLLGWSLPTIQALFTEISGVKGIYGAFLRYVFMFLPHAAVCEVLTNLVLMNSLASGTMKASELVNWLDYQKIGCPLLYLGVTIFLNWIICIAVDSSTTYPMGEPRLKALVKQVLDAFRTCFHVATCRGMGLRQRWLTRNVSAGSSAGAPSTVASPNQVDFQYPHVSAFREGIKKCRNVDGLGLHLQEEEARAAEALCRPHRLPRNKILASAPQQQLQDSCAKVEVAEKSSITAQFSLCCLIVGVNGSGKSTTFSILGSQKRQDGGSVFIDGWDTLTHPAKTRAKLRYCPQIDALLPALTGAEHVYFYGCLLGLSGSQLSMFCEEFFATIGCKQFMHRLVKSYSGGTKRKLSLGLAMLGSVDLLLLDEPTNGVDPESRHMLWRMIENAKNCKVAGKAILLTSHSMEECEVLSDEMGIIYKGKMLCVGTPTEIRAAYGHGYQIECVFFTSAVTLEPLLPRRFISTLLAKFQTLHVVRWMAYKVTASVPKKDASLTAIFCEIEAIKATLTACVETMNWVFNSLGIEAYGVSETTLEEVFMEVNHRAEEANKSNGG
ncbi:hypothetical protein Esti_003959 [Eimeria stiedai]